MKKMNISLLAFFAAITLLIGFGSCKDDMKDTPVKEPDGLFFSGVFNEKNKSIVVGNNGYISVNSDSLYDDGTLNHFSTSTRFYQSSTGFYITSKEIVVFEYKQNFENNIAEKDDLFHGMMSRSSIPFLTYASNADSSKAVGLSIRWRDNNGKWWTTAGGPQSVAVTVDSTFNTTIEGLSSRKLFISASEFTLFEVDGTDTKMVRDAKARLFFYNTKFY